MLVLAQEAASAPAAAPAQNSAPAGGGLSSFLIFIPIFGLMYFLMIRPQQKKQKELQNFQNTVAIGTEVVTQGGIFGTVKKVDELNNSLHIEIARDVIIRVTRNAVYPTAQAAAETTKK